MLDTLSTPFGEFLIETSEQGIVACSTWHRPHPAAHTDDSVSARPHLDAARTALTEYAAGTRRDFSTLRLVPVGTEFQQRVWRALRELPYASTTTYAELAHAIGRPGAARAVGQANAKNPIAILQPCHRVIGARGALSGFAGGIAMKRALIEHEARVDALGRVADARGEATRSPAASGARR